MGGGLANRNHLYGILALQMEFITHDQLVAAINIWVKDKSRAIGPILIELKAITPKDHELLEPLVERHIANHKGDAAKSLAALSSSAGVREKLRSLSDPDVQASMANLSEETAMGAPEPSWHPPGKERSPGRYRILRPHAKGGLGEVFVAEDTELGRRVALKEIQDRYSRDPDARSRFVVEAEITGGLEHPGIVPVYGLGNYDDGRPFYAMRFIHGASLHDAIRRFHDKSRSITPAERNVEFRSLLGRFIDVCQAIGYAHTRGVLHRDLKPGNIMLGKYGETLVVDWGLAKAGVTEPGRSTVPEREPESHLGQLRSSGTGSGTPTQVGQALGTPSYMSPEQAAGRLDDLGPATDIYSLGATLYVLLTGNPPFAGSAAEVIRKVETGEFEAPSKQNADVAKPLEAICMKAMARQPRDRYETALTLAADVEHWLADEPVSAYTEPWSDRARRWARRHRTAVTTAGALLAMTAVALGVGLFAVDRERRRADEAARLAATVLDTMITNDVLAAVEQQEQIPDRQLRFYGQTDDFYVRLAALGTSATDDKAKRALLAKRSAMALARLDRLEAAEAAARRAINLYGELAVADGKNAAVRAEVAECHYNLAFVLDKRKKHTESDAAYQLSLTTLEAVLKDNPSNDAIRIQMVRTTANLSERARSENKLAMAADYIERAIALQAALSEKEPDNEEHREAVGVLQYCRAGILTAQNKPSAAAECLLKAMKSHAALVRDVPDRRDYVIKLSEIAADLGDLQFVDKKLTEAEECHRQALQIWRELVAKNRAKSKYRTRLAESYRNLGRALCAQAEPNKYQEAELLAAECEAIVDDPDNPGHCRYYCAALFGCCAAAAKDVKVKEQHADRCVALLREALAKGYALTAKQINDEVGFVTAKTHPSWQKLSGELKP